MAEVVVNYLIERLLEFGRENVELIAGVQDDVNSLVADLQGLKAFLKDASQIHRDAEAWKNAVKEIRVVVDKAEDAIDKFLLEAKQQYDKKWIDIPHWINVRSVAKQIQSIRNSINQVCAQNQDLLDDSVLVTTANQPREQDFLDEDDAVGFDDAAYTVIERLTGGSKHLEAVPIVGMPGLGKSALARNVYKDPRITYEFVTRIWVAVYRTYTKKEVLLKLLSHFTTITVEHENMTEDQITNAISTFLEIGGRCLIVLDDVWDGRVVDFAKRVFPKNDKGHRIMMTTRQVDTASCFTGDIHYLHFLSDADSVLLLKKKVFGKDSCPSEFEEPGISIAKKCGGLPLAIVIIAGALAGCTTRREWHLVDQYIGDLLINRDDPDSCLGFVKLSYDLLPYYQKACFLYCATFPRGFDIPVWKLIRLWIGEGFIPRQNLTLEEQAEYCLNDLIRKNLLMVKNRMSDGKAKTVRIDDMLYQFCKMEASEEDIFQEVTRARDHSWAINDSEICRRLCIHSSVLYDFLCSLGKTTPNENVRSFLSFSSERMDMPAPVIKAFHAAFPLIKVLDVEPIKFSFTRKFYQLMHLRYISISGDFKALPENFGMFQYLETLIINRTNREISFEVRADIWSMMRLRHLHTNAPAILSPPCDSTSKEHECYIQTLSTIAPECCTKKAFARAHNLRKLTIRGQVVALLDNNVDDLRELAKLKQLENLKFVNNDKDTGRRTVALPVFIFPNSLRKLTLVGTRFEWSEMYKLGKLESLEVLKLKENAFKGEFWELDISSFNSLTVLWIERTDLQTWRVSHLNFPSLKKLALISCENLEEIPSCLVDIPNLQEIKLENSNKATVRSARKIANMKMERRGSTSGFTLKVFPPYVDEAES